MVEGAFIVTFADAFQEGLGYWMRGVYRLEPGPIGPALVLDGASLDAYDVPMPGPRQGVRDWTRAADWVSPLFDLLRLGGQGSRAVALDSLYDHWVACGTCRDCARLEARVVAFASHWGVLGAAGLDYLGYLDVRPFRERGAFGSTDLPTPVRPEPVAVFLYGAVLLWRWWRTYTVLVEDGVPSLWDVLLWGRAPETRRLATEQFERLYAAVPDAVPPGRSVRDVAEVVAHRMMVQPLLWGVMGDARWLAPPSVPADAAPDAATPDAFERRLDAVLADPAKARLLIDRVTRALLEPHLGPSTEQALRGGTVGPGQPPPAFMATIESAVARQASVGQHPGLNEILSAVRMLAVPGRPVLATRYWAPSLWHALHVMLYLHLVRGDAVLAVCGWDKCRGPLLRIPRAERAHPRQYCSVACRQAAKRARAGAHPAPARSETDDDRGPHLR